MIYLLLCLYAYKHGQTNAFLYSLKGAEALKRNEHVDLVIERLLFVLGIAIGGAYGSLGFTGAYLYLMEVIAAILAFSFFHNGAYYVMRAKINGSYYAVGLIYGWKAAFRIWKHQSPTTTARFDFSYKTRLYMLLASFGVLIAGYSMIIWAF